MQKIYCRSIRPDGYGEGVVPEMNEPNRKVHDELMSMKTKHIVEVLWNATVGKWNDHLASLPVLYLIHPDLAKVGWVGEHEEGYEVYNGTGYSLCSKSEWFGHGAMERRKVLVPVEGKEVVGDPFIDKKCVQCGKEYRGLPDGLYCSIRCWGAHCLQGIPHLPTQSNPTPVTGEAGDANTILLKHIGIAPAGNFYLIGHGVSIRDQVIKAMHEYASQCTAPLEARIRGLEELLLEIDKSLYIGPDLDDTEILKWYIDVVTVIKDEIKSILPGASSSSKTP